MYTMLHSECNKVVPFFCRLFFRVPHQLSSIEWSLAPSQFEKPGDATVPKYDNEL